MFDEALERLVRETDADLAVFCDYEGEAIALAAPEMESYDVQITGAQLGALLFKLQEIARSYGQGERVAVQCLTDSRTMLIETLPGGYYVVLGLAPDKLWPRARVLLREVADRFLLEL